MSGHNTKKTSKLVGMLFTRAAAKIGIPVCIGLSVVNFTIYASYIEKQRLLTAALTERSECMNTLHDRANIEKKNVQLPICPLASITINNERFIAASIPFGLADV